MKGIWGEVVAGVGEWDGRHGRKRKTRAPQTKHREELIITVCYSSKTRSSSSCQLAMSTTPSLVFRSPVSRSEVASPRVPAFDTELLRAYMKKLLQATLQHAVWPRDRDQVKSWMKDIKERVKDRMLEIQPSGFKYVVLVQINENLNQGGRADMVSHWEDGDACIHELFYNDSIICTCIALAIRSSS